MTRDASAFRAASLSSKHITIKAEMADKNATGTQKPSKGASSKKGKKRIAVLHDNPPLPGKKFFLASWISPESRQKHEVYAYKIHDMCEELDTAKQLCRYYQSLDPDFNVAIGTVGKWSPWVFDENEIPAEYADQRLTDLVRSHREKNKIDDDRWKQNVDKHIGEIQHATTKEGQEELANRKEPAISMRFKMKQLELTIKRRKEELASMEEVYHTTYSKQERADAKRAELPLSEPAPMQYALLSSAREANEGVGDTEEIPLALLQ